MNEGRQVHLEWTPYKGWEPGRNIISWRSWMKNGHWQVLEAGEWKSIAVRLSGISTNKDIDCTRLRTSNGTFLNTDTFGLESNHEKNHDEC